MMRRPLTLSQAAYGLLLCQVPDEPAARQTRPHVAPYKLDPRDSKR